MKIKHFICLMPATVMLMTMASCVPSTPARDGFTVVEWGGSQVREP